jgi:hypothetical protein
MYFSTSGGREVTTKRQLDGLCSLLKLTSHIPMFQDLRVIICMRQQDNEGMKTSLPPEVEKYIQCNSQE